MTAPRVTERPLATSGFGEQVLKRDLLLKTSADAQAEVRFTSKLPIGRRGASLYVENVEVTQGRVDAIAPDNLTAGVLLQGPKNVQAITAAGRLSMVVFDDHVSVTVLKGQALVGKSGLFKPLSGNKIRTFDLTRGDFSDRDRLGAPQAHSGGLNFSLGGSVPISLRASAVSGAASYCGFLFDQTSEIVAESCGHTNPENIAFDAPRAGNFWGAVSAVDSDGFAGELSKPTLVRILGLAERYEIKNGTVLLAPGQRAQIVGYEGLVMRYGTSPEFIPASDSVGIPGRKATTIEFRNPNNAAEYAFLSLRPQLLKSRIKIGPALGTWPENEVTISVQMWDGEGRSLDILNKHTVVTRVGLKEVDVNFARQGDKLVGVLQPQRGPGPWVVRVSILDSAGDEVTRDFLEIASAPKRPRDELGKEALDAVHKRLATK